MTKEFKINFGLHTSEESYSDIYDFLLENKEFVTEMFLEALQVGDIDADAYTFKRMFMDLGWTVENGEDDEEELYDEFIISSD